MIVETSHYVQLIIALGAGIVLFVLAYVLPARVLIWVLLLLIPFQIINSKYGSINMVLTYMIGFAFFLRGRFVRLPLLGAVIFIMVAYLLSFTQALPGTTRDHGFYMIAIVSNFVLFYLAYNYIRTSGNYRDVWTILLILNVLVLIYCGIEMVAGSSGLKILGLTELEIRSARAEGGRLSGPFGAVAMTADYLGIQSIICIYALMRTHLTRQRVFLLGLLAGNMGILIATGNRGGVVSLVAGIAAFLFLFRKELGVRKIIAWVVTGSLVFAVSGFVIVKYTRYNVLFERLEATEFVGLLPDTRVGWSEMWGEIVSKPVFGHGPRLRLENEVVRRIPGHTRIGYPHSGYLYLIYTVGFVGLLAYAWFFSVLARQYLMGRISRARDPLLRGLPRLGIAILVLFVVSQGRMEMFRYMLHAYQQYLFMLVGVFLAFTHLALSRGEAEESRNSSEITKRSRAVLRYRGNPGSE